jgi:hypothetical protein
MTADVLPGTSAREHTRILRFSHLQATLKVYSRKVSAETSGAPTLDKLRIEPHFPRWPPLQRNDRIGS